MRVSRFSSRDLRRSRSGPAIAAIVLSIASLLAGCRRDDSAPVARLTVDPGRLRLDFPGVAPLRLEWTPLAALEDAAGIRRVAVFVHVLDRPHHVLRTFDHDLPGGWKPGQTLHDEIEIYQSALALQLAPGEYLVSAGLYDPASGYRWPLAVNGPDLGRREYRVATLEVGGSSPDVPRFLFAGSWGPLEEPGNQQILARRCLRGAGTLAIRGARAAGEVRLLLEAGSSGASLESDCGTNGIRLPAGFSGWVGVPVMSNACEVRFEIPGRSDSGHGSSFCVDVLAWRESAGGVSAARTTP